jgi:DNA invertase Pin-like site-specific DNA recombinase
MADNKDTTTRQRGHTLTVSFRSSLSAAEAREYVEDAMGLMARRLAKRAEAGLPGAPPHPMAGVACAVAAGGEFPPAGPYNQGEDNPRARLTDLQVREIKEKADKGAKYGTLAREYGVNVSTVCRARKRADRCKAM